MELKIDGGIVSEARFKGDGCAISIAAASLLTEIIIGTEITELIADDQLISALQSDIQPARNNTLPSHLPHSETAWATDNTDFKSRFFSVFICGLESDKLHAGTVGTLNRSHHKLTTATWAIRERVFFAFRGRQQLFRLNVTLGNF